MDTYDLVITGGRVIDPETGLDAVRNVGIKGDQIAALIAAFQGEGWGVGIFGLVCLVIGLVLMFNSVVGGAALIWLTALLLVIQGVIGLFWSFFRR